MTFTLISQEIHCFVTQILNVQEVVREHMNAGSQNGFVCRDGSAASIDAAARTTSSISDLEYFIDNASNAARTTTTNIAPSKVSNVLGSAGSEQAENAREAMIKRDHATERETHSNTGWRRSAGEKVEGGTGSVFNESIWSAPSAHANVNRVNAQGISTDAGGFFMPPAPPFTFPPSTPVLFPPPQIPVLYPPSQIPVLYPPPPIPVLLPPPPIPVLLPPYVPPPVGLGYAIPPTPVWGSNHPPHHLRPPTRPVRLSRENNRTVRFEEAVGENLYSAASDLVNRRYLSRAPAHDDDRDNIIRGEVSSVERERKKGCTPIIQQESYARDKKITWHSCDFTGCSYKAKQKNSLKQHKMFVHNVGVTWHHCDVPGCEYKAKQGSDLKKHKSHMHNIDVTWHRCDVNGCNYQAKQKGLLKRHMRLVHDVDFP